MDLCFSSRWENVTNDKPSFFFRPERLRNDAIISFNLDCELSFSVADGPWNLLDHPRNGPSLNSGWRREDRPMIDERCSIIFADITNCCNLDTRIRETVRSDLVSVPHSRWTLHSRCMDGECQSLLEGVDKHSATTRIPLFHYVCQRFDDEFPRVD